MFIPCVKCPGCGLYNGFTADTCKCGMQVKPTRTNGYVIMDTASKVVFSIDKPSEKTAVSPDELGNISEEPQIYEQTCKNCGRKTYLTGPARKPRTCWCCSKLISAAPVPFDCKPESEEKKSPASRVELPNPSKPAEPDPIPEDPGDKKFASMGGSIAGTPPAAKSHPLAADSDDDDDDDDSGSWGFLAGPGGNGAKTPPAPPAQPASPAQPPRSWRESPLQPSPAAGSKTISLLDRYSHAVLMSLTPEQAGTSVMLGREAGLAELLMRDHKVSRRHCSLRFAGGRWFVHDENSANGVFVNGRDIGLNGTCELTDGSVLQFGHDTGISPAVVIKLG